MHRLRKIIKSSFIGFVVALQIVAYPAMTFADATDPAAVDPVDSTAQTTTQSPESTPATQPTDDTTPTTSTAADVTTTPPAPPSTLSSTSPADPVGPTAPTGVQAPTGAAASTYTKNPDGTWSNDLYIWDPVTGQTRPKTPQTYSYNPTTKLWDTTEWYYSPEAGKYLPNVVSVAQKPVQPKATALSTAAGLGASISQTGPSSNNNIVLGGSNSGTFDMFFDARISNAIGQMSRSGNASVQGSTVGGSANSGDAQSIANLLNLLQSSWGTLGSDNISTFVANVDGNVVGDLLIDPALIGGSGNSKLDVNIAKNGQISNDVNLDSQSGDASVGGNTVGGDAKSGNASAVANLLNLINSSITAKKSFVGVLNINGDLEGDILLPPGLLQSIIASSGPSSTNTIKDSGNTNLNANVSTNSTINNNVTNDAGSGNATVGNNTNGGTASSGSATNNITLLNLTGHRVVAKDALLVFVNVFGNWVGLIMNAPAGTNAVAATGPNSTNTIDSEHNTDISLNATENNQINNNIHTAAHSGNASVSGNTVGGSARSGDASAGANILNMIDSNFNISDWFGVLFINVFGTWHGSFGVDTPYGNPAVATGGRGSGISSSITTPLADPAVFSFIPKNNSLLGASGGVGGSQTSAQVASATTTAPAPTTTPTKASSTPTLAPTQFATIRRANWTWTIAGVSSAVMLLGIERFLSFRRRIV